MAIMDEPLTTLLPWIATAAIIVLGSYQLFAKRKHNNNAEHKNDKVTIPWAPGYVPLLGHALEYQKDSPGFLLRAASASKDGIFQLNLAGKHMIVVCNNHNHSSDNDNNLQRQLATLPESILSAKQAVADIGFEQTLGRLNVYEGTTLHKGIIKGHLALNGSGDDKDAMVSQWTRAIQQVMQRETTLGKPCEFLDWMRRVMLRTTLDVMVGTAFLQMEEESSTTDGVDFVDTFMKFQDTLEDVTAKAVVLPRFIALNCFLLPLERRREKLQKVIEKRLERILQQKPAHGDYSQSIHSVGFWLQEVLIDDKQYNLADVSEFIVGLLFAAHKNPAIGAAQSYLFLREHCNDSNNADLLESCQHEARQFLEHPSWNQIVSDRNNEYNALQRVCYESLRITAHSIGAVRTAKQDVTIEMTTETNNESSTYKYLIPQGASVSFSHIVPNVNTSEWGRDANQFNTQRQSANDSYKDEYKFTTFSHGVHKCPGQYLAMILLQASLSVLLTEYKVDFLTKIPPLCFERATLAQRKGPVQAVVESKSQ